MNNRYIVFDVETPNYANDRISSIGLCVVENLTVTEKYYGLVNPDTHFDSFNIKLTGITPQMVIDQPNFPELWNRKLGSLISSGILIAHNAPFDMGVLAKCMHFYGIEEPHRLDYACTVRMSKKALPTLPNHKLNTVSDYLSVKLNHHNALSDAYAAAKILIYCLEHGCDINSFIKTQVI